MNKIIFSRHAIAQMRERKISGTEVKAVISNPTNVSERSVGKFQSVKLTKRNGKSYALVVIWRKTNSDNRVITTFLTSKVKKYL